MCQTLLSSTSHLGFEVDGEKSVTGGSHDEGEEAEPYAWDAQHVLHGDLLAQGPGAVRRRLH